MTDPPKYNKVCLGCQEKCRQPAFVIFVACPHYKKRVVSSKVRVPKPQNESTDTRERDGRSKSNSYTLSLF